MLLRLSGITSATVYQHEMIKNNSLFSANNLHLKQNGEYCGHGGCGGQVRPPGGHDGQLQPHAEGDTFKNIALNQFEST